MPRFVISIATAGALVLLCALAVLYAVATPDVVPATAAEAVFSAERAMVHVRAMAQRPHPSGSRDHVRVRTYIMSQLGQMGIAPEYQEATGVGTRYPAAGHVGNVIGVLPGSQPGNPPSAVLLMAHYDGVPAGPAAGDDAAGSAVLLEVARALRAGLPLRHDVIFLWTDGEESGLLGAAAFVREHPLASRVAVIMNFEARGTGGPSFMFETGPGNLDVTRVLRRVGGARATSLSTAVYRQLPNDTDLSEMAVLAKPAMNFAFIAGQERYHTSEDDVAHLDPRSVQDHGDQALALAREFATEPLPRPVTGDAVFFDVPVLGLIVYAESWATALAVLALALAVLAVARLRRAEPHVTQFRWLRDTAFGAAGMVVAALLAAGVGVAVIEAVRRLHIAIGSGSPAWSGLYLGAIALLALAVAAAVYAVTRLVATPRGAHAGAAIIWALVSLVVALIAPGVSFLFTWPALFGVSTALVATLVRNRALVRLDAWIAALVIVFLLVPTLYLIAGVALGLAATSTVLVCVLTACGAWLLAPLLEDLEGARRWYAPAGFAMVGLLLVAAGAATVRHDADHPTRASLAYAFDADSGAAWLTGSSGSAVGREYIRAVVAAMPAPENSVRPPSWIPAGWLAAGITSVPLAPVPLPSTELVGDTVGPQSRRVSLRVRPAPGTLGITMSMDSSSVGAATINGRPVDRSRYRRPGGSRWSLDFVAPPDSGFVLEVLLTSPGPAELTLLARMSGLPAIPELNVPERPPGVLPSQNGDVSVVYKRVRL